MIRLYCYHSKGNGHDNLICGDLRRHSLAEIWQRYQDAWKQPQVIDFTKKVIEDTELLKEANKWVEL